MVLTYSDAHCGTQLLGIGVALAVGIPDAPTGAGFTNHQKTKNCPNAVADIQSPLLVNTSLPFFTPRRLRMESATCCRSRAFPFRRRMEITACILVHAQSV